MNRIKNTIGAAGAAKRAGFSLLEMEVALIVLAIALTGICPLIVMHWRVLGALDRRLSAGTPHYLIPSQDAWARKLGAGAAIVEIDPGPPPAPPTLLIDDQTSGYSESGGGWNTASDPQALDGYYRWSLPLPPGTPGNTAAWSFSGLAPGAYRVEATWVEGPDRASNALYNVYDGMNLQGSVSVSQQIHPALIANDGRAWQLVYKLLCTSGSTRVELSGQGNGRVIADAVRLVPVRNTVVVLSLDRSLTSQTVTAQVAVTVQVPQP
jgi:hypothetical protein